MRPSVTADRPRLLEAGRQPAKPMVWLRPLHLSVYGHTAATAGPLFGRLPSSTELPKSASDGTFRVTSSGFFPRGSAISAGPRLE